MSFELAFLAASVAFGESVDDALAALGDGAVRARALEPVLRTGSREARARALAQHLAPVVAEMQAMEIAWHR